MPAVSWDFDVLIVGGGPAGSTCAAELRRRGVHAAIIDRARFPRVKLCAGWISDPIWDVLSLAPRQYPRGLWEWHRCHVYYDGRRYTVPAHGHFIRRYEFDDYLLQRAGVPVFEHHVRTITRDGERWCIDDTFRAPYLVGAGGSQCPVARQLFGNKTDAPVGVKERELATDAEAVAATRVGADGEPELLLHRDLRGYSWNVPKGAWLNIGCGTVAAREVKPAWEAARHFLLEARHIPQSAAAQLEHMKGWSYHLFEPAHLEHSVREGAVLVGDALGLAQPLTAEGILPGTLSGAVAAASIADGAVAHYPERLAAHPIIRDYKTLHAAKAGAARVLPGQKQSETHAAIGVAASPERSSALAAAHYGMRQGLQAATRWATARSFAWLFSGKPLPAGGLLASAMHLLARRRADEYPTHLPTRP